MRRWPFRAAGWNSARRCAKFRVIISRILPTSIASMKQAISGVAPPELGEVTVMTVWPSIAAYPLGRGLGRLYRIRAGVGLITIGKLFMAVTIPVALALFAWSLLPFVMRRYTLTNRRVIIQKGLKAVGGSYVDLDRFDSIEVKVLPGQQWYPAGDLVFLRGNVETFRLEGVPRPETFRQTCLKARMSYVGVKQATGRQLVGV